MEGRVYNTGQSVAISSNAGRIIASAPIDDRPDLPFIIPSLFDLQVNGALGIGFTSDNLTLEEIRTVAVEMGRHHVGGFAPTVITSSFATIRNSFQALARAVEEDVALDRAMPAFHLEGPYIAAEDGPRGAHPLEHVRDPDWDEFRRWQDAAGGRIKIVTLAPERAGAIDFIGRLCADGIVAAIGHMAASPQQIRDAVSAGAKLSTHLGNGSHAMLPRHENYLWEQLAHDDLLASVIADGHHLPAALLKTIVRAKTTSRLILISDASPLAGLPPGLYQHWGADLDVEPSGRIGVAGTAYLAGSGAFLDDCVAHLIRTVGVSPVDAIAMASVNPRRLLGLPQPRLEIGAAWDFTLIPASVLESKLRASGFFAAEPPV